MSNGFRQGSVVFILIVVFGLIAQQLERLRASSASQWKRSFEHQKTAKHQENRFIKCLLEADSELTLEYPHDAEDHFTEIHDALSHWLQGSPNHKMHEYSGYAGPWIENHWIEYFSSGLNVSNSGESGVAGQSLSERFGPFIPLFVPWVDTWVNNRTSFSLLNDTIASLLRDNVAYITVAQNAVGLVCAYGRPNILVLSTGGYGQVPIPLVKEEIPIMNSRPPSERKIVFNYVGTKAHAPRHLRERMHTILSSRPENCSHCHNRRFYKFYKGKRWANIMVDSLFSLAPRGFGRTSFHVLECLQMGLIPIHIYNDIPWIPYKKLLMGGPNPIVYATNLSNLIQFTKNLDKIPLDEIQKKEDRILTLRESHFLIPGIMSQIRNLMVGQETDLECYELPSSYRDAKRPGEIVPPDIL